MRVFLPSHRRLALAGITFTLTFTTATLLWNRGREFGHEEALRPTPGLALAPKIAIDTTDYAQKLAMLRAKLPTARTVEQKLALAGEFGELALGAHHRNQGEGKLSLMAYDEALALQRAVKDSRGEAGTLMNRATTVAMLGRPTEAEKDLRTALALYEVLPDSDLPQAEVLYRLGERLGVGGHYDEARTLLDRSLRIRQKKAEHNGEADCLAALGQLAYEEAQYALARQFLGQAAQSFAALGKAPARAAVLGQLGDVALAEGELAEAEKCYGEGLAIWKEEKHELWIGKFLTRQARVALARKQWDQAETLAQKSKQLMETSNGPTSVAGPLMVQAEVAAQRGDKVQAKVLLIAAQALHERAGRAFGLRRVEQQLQKL